MGNYSNIKLFAMVPAMSELTVTSKTLIQYQIKDMAKLVLVADYAFSFRPLPADIKSKFKYKLTNNVTLTSTKIVDEEPKTIDDKAIIALPPALPDSK